MEEKHAKGSPPEHGRPKGTVAALFDSMQQAEEALLELEQNGFDRETMGMAFPEGSHSPPSSPSTGREETGTRAAVFAGAPTAGFPGWTMGMAPWAFAGVGPVVVLGSLSLGRRADGPDDLRGLIMSLGLHEDVFGGLEGGFRRGQILVTVAAPDKEAIASTILDRNGGHSLRR
jgi:hypothetical protein